MKYDMKALAHDFWYGKPHQERRLGDLYIDKTGLYKHSCLLYTSRCV